MKAHGYCLFCRRIKRINIRPHQLNERIPYGECDACIEARRVANRGVRGSGSSQQPPRKDRK